MRQIRFFTTYNKRTKDYEGSLVDGGATIITMEEREGVSLVYQGRHNGKSAGLDGQEYTGGLVTAIPPGSQPKGKGIKRAKFKTPFGAIQEGSN